MNVEVLEQLMDNKKITSYYQLAKKMNLPYTSLLDWVHGKGQKICNLKLISDFLGVDVYYLLAPTRYYYVLLEDNTLLSSLVCDREDEMACFCRLLLQEEW